MSNIHYSEGLFPNNIYAPDYQFAYKNGFIYGLFNGDQWAAKKHCDCKPANIFVTDVKVAVSKSITMTITYSDKTMSSVKVEIGNKYVIKYIQNGELIQVVGIVTAIGDTGTTISANCPCSTVDYILQIDCSTINNSSVINIRASMIREISLYNGTEGLTNEIPVSTTNGATSFGTFNNIIINNATIDNNGNLTAGTIVNAKFTENTSAAIGGCSTGVNSQNTNINVYNGITTGGTMTGGKVLSGKVYSPICEGGIANDGLLTGCTVKANEGKLVVLDSQIYNGSTTDGIIFIPTFDESIVNDGTRSGSDMVTYGSTVFGLKAYGGSTSGGVLYGGIAMGTIDGIQFTIENGETTGGTTMRAIVNGGKVVGGSVVGATTIGAVVYGGTAEGGTTVGGTTVLGANGIIKPASGLVVPNGLANPVNDFAQFFEKDIDELIIWWKHNRIESNLSNYRGPA